MTSLFMAPPAPAARVGGVFDGFLALPRSPMAVELGFMFGGSETDRSEGIRLGLSAEFGSTGGADSLEELDSDSASSAPGEAGAPRSSGRSMSSGVAGIESEPLMAATAEDDVEATKQLSGADGAAASARGCFCKPCNFLQCCVSCWIRRRRGVFDLSSRRMLAIFNCELSGGDQTVLSWGTGDFGPKSARNLRSITSVEENLKSLRRQRGANVQMSSPVNCR